MAPSKPCIKTENNLKSPRTPKPVHLKSAQSPSAVLITGTVSPQTIWASQDVCDGVTWDYTSPLRQELRSAKLHGKTSITELLKCVNDAKEHQKQDDKTSLLETWMSVETNITPIPKSKSFDQSSLKRKNPQNKRARHLAKELEELTEAVDKKDLIKQVKSRSCYQTNNCDNLKTLGYDFSVIDNSSSSSKGALSADEVWENVNESFLIEVTQFVEQVENNYSSQNKPSDSDCKSKEFKNIDHNFSQEAKVNFEKCDENDEYWESDNSLEEIISSLKEDQLVKPGITSKNVQNESSNSSIDLFNEDEIDTFEMFCVKNELKEENVNAKNSVKNELLGQIYKNITRENGIVINNTSPVMKSELVENKPNQKCTPEEIARKREEAMKRRQKNIKKAR